GHDPHRARRLPDHSARGPLMDRSAAARPRVDSATTHPYCRNDSTSAEAGSTRERRMRNLTIAIAVSVVVGLGAAAAWLTAAPTPAAAELAHTVWPMFHGGLAHTGLSSVAGPATSDVKIKWIYDNPARWVCQWACVVFRSSPTIGADGTIYIGVGFAPLCAID